MPLSSPRPCRRLGCSALTRNGFCDKHSASDTRRSSRARGYDTAWDKTSKRYRQAHPLCEKHKAQGELVAAHLVDHIVPLHVAPTRKHDETNLQSLCRACHAAKTIEDGAKYGSATTHPQRRA